LYPLAIYGSLVPRVISRSMKRDCKTYNEWFDTHACDTVFDLSNEPLEIEEF
jgi:hypothetical protein